MREGRSTSDKARSGVAIATGRLTRNQEWMYDYRKKEKGGGCRCLGVGGWGLKGLVAGCAGQNLKTDSEK